MDYQCASDAMRGAGELQWGFKNLVAEPEGYDPEFPEWGCGTEFDHREDGSNIFTPEWEKGGLLFPGCSYVRLLIPTMDEVVGLTLCTLPENPGEPDMTGWTQYSEVSAEFLPGGDIEFTIDIGNEPPGYPGSPLNDWSLPPRLWRIRAYCYLDESTWINGIVGYHPDAISPMDYPTSGRTWDSLACQIRVEFWPEDELRPRQDIFPE